MAYNIVLFDLDGTLTDSGEGIINSVIYSLKKRGITEDDREKLKCFVGPPLEESYIRYYGFNDIESKKAVEYYREYYQEKGIFENNLYNGIENLLLNLKNNGKKLILTTSKPEYYAEKIVRYFKKEKYLDGVIGSNMDGTLTDKKELIEKVLETKCSRSNKSEIVMVGDRKYDIIGAKKNEIKSIGVLYGYGTREELISAGADHIADNIENLNKIIINSGC